MFDVPVVMSVLWRLTGLQETFAREPPGGSSSSSWPLLSAVYAAAVYLSYACACALFACNRFAAAYRPSSGPPPSAGNGTATGGGGKLQILVIRDTNEALLFVASTTVHWCLAAYRREHVLVRREHAAVADQLFGTAAGRDAPPSSRGRRAMDACCWSLYALLAVALSLDVYGYAGTASRAAYAAVHVWGHYVLLTGSVQFAVVVFGLRRCYCQLNGRMRAATGADTRPDGLEDFDRAAHDGGGGLSVVVGAGPSARSPTDEPIRRGRDVVFVDVLDKANLLTMLKYWSDLHWSITQIVSKVNNLFRFRLFVFFLCGLLHLMFTPYLLSLTILNENIDVLPYIIERALWFVIHILHVVLMIYPCALLGEEAAKTQILLGSYLNTKIDFFDIKKIETYAQQLAANKPEFSIYSMFVIDKQLVITLTGAVATYLVIILQLQGQS